MAIKTTTLRSASCHSRNSGPSSLPWSSMGGTDTGAGVTGTTSHFGSVGHWARPVLANK